MIKKIDLYEGQSIELNSSVGWLLKYRAQFGRDILPDILPAIMAVTNIALDSIENDEITSDSLLKALDGERAENAIMELASLEFVTVLQVTWALAKNANKNIEPPEEWAEQFEVFPMDVLIPEIFKMVVESSVSSKNSTRLLKKLKKTAPVG